MLTYESLTEQAKLRGMPGNKMRGVLREYLQVLILKEIYKADTGKHLYFTGGTYLRLVHNLKRFSEDLDFNCDELSGGQFETLLDKVKTELARSNIIADVNFKHWRNIFAGNLIFPEIEKAYNVKSAYSKKAGIVIKIETNTPKWKIVRESEVINGFGEIFTCGCTDKSALFADKIDALVKKTRARHLYDIIFMLSQNYPINRKVLASLGIKENPLEVIAKRVKSFSPAELKKQAEELRPFLFEDAQADLIANADTVVPSLIAKYRADL
jgi:predicted nucleotidyltransferase component of viral defense system